MTELHIPTLRRLAEKQLRETGNVSNETLDLIIEDWGIELDSMNVFHIFFSANA